MISSYLAKICSELVFRAANISHYNFVFFPKHQFLGVAVPFVFLLLEISFVYMDNNSGLCYRGMSLDSRELDLDQSSYSPDAI